jgi:hypothetical protein
MLNVTANDSTTNITEKSFSTSIDANISNQPGTKLDETKSKASSPPAPSIVYRLYLLFKYEFISATAVKVFSDVLQFANPLLLQ